MKGICLIVRDFINDEEGLTVVEYVVGAGFIVIVIGVFFTNFGRDLSDKLTSYFS